MKAPRSFQGNKTLLFLIYDRVSHKKDEKKTNTQPLMENYAGHAIYDILLNEQRLKREVNSPLLNCSAY